VPLCFAKKLTAHYC